MRKLSRQTLACVVGCLLAAACGGGGGGGGQQTTKYKVGGTVSGLSGAGLVLHSSVGEDVPVTGNGAFTFPTAVATGTAYTVTVAQQPTTPWQTCAVANGAGTVQAADVATVAVTCTTNTYAVGGSVTGLAGSGLVLSNGAEDLPVAAGATTFQFPTRVASGGAYAVTVKTQPSSPSQTCAVTSGSGDVAGGDVTSVAVACTTATFSVGGTAPANLATLSISVNGGAPQTLTAPPQGPFAFANVPSGASYTVTATRPTYTCTVNNGNGVVGSANVTNLTVTCAQAAFTISGAVAGVPATGLTLSNGSASTSVAAGATTFAFTAPLATGASYAVTVQSPPAGLTCNVTNGTGTIASANVTNVSVSCSSAIAAAGWAPPANWGGLWATSDTTMVQHAYADASGLHFDKGPTLAMLDAAGAPATPPAPYRLGGLGAGDRYGVGPFAEAVNYRASDATQLNGLPRDFLVCAVVKPGRNRAFDSNEAPIIAKGVGDGQNPVYGPNGGGWVLMQMHESWCFHYEYKDQATNSSHIFMAPVANFFPGQDFNNVLASPQPVPSYLQPDPSLVVVCGGRSGDKIVVAANGVDDPYLTNYAEYSLAAGVDQEMMERFSAATAAAPYAGPFVLDEATNVPLTIGGYYKPSRGTVSLHTDHPETNTPPPGPPATPTPTSDRGDVDSFQDHSFGGYVYETGIWTLAPGDDVKAKIRERVNGIIGTVNAATSSPTLYARNREASIVGADSKLHTVGRHAPRIDPAKGQVFGLQSWNRVAYWRAGNVEAYPYPLVYAAGENLTLWTPSTGVTVTPATGTPPSVSPPNDNRYTAAQLVTLPAGGSLSIDLDQALPGAPGTAVPKPTRPTWDFSGPIQGQLWVMPTTAGTLRVQKTAPQPGHGAACANLGETCEQKDVALTAPMVNQWNRVSLNGAFTADATQAGGVTTNKGKLVLFNSGGSPLTFYAWGVQLTQLGGGADLGSFDPGELMYDWSPSQMHDTNGTIAAADDPLVTRDVLRVPVASPPAAGTPFCVGAEAFLPSGLPWNAFQNERTLISWVDSPTAPAATLRLFVAGAGADAGKLCARWGTNNAVCSDAALPASLANDAKHVLRACVAANGALRLAADATQLGAGGASGAPNPPNLSGGTFLVGNGTARADAPQTPWHGFVSRVLVCPDNGGAGADCR